MNEEYEEDRPITPEELAKFKAMAAAAGMTFEEYVKHVLFKMLADEAAIEEANEIVEPHLTGDDWKLDEQ
jgi:hypothetical protein